MGMASEPPGGVNPMIVTAVLFGVGVVLLLVGAFVYPPLHDLPAAFDWTFASGVFLALLAIHWVILRERRRALTKLALLCFFLVPTALALTVGGVMTVNGLFDRARSSHHTALVVDAYLARNTKPPGWPYPRILVKSWTTDEPDPWILVDRRLYDSVTPGNSAVDIVTKPGYLDIEWILEVRIEPVGGVSIGPFGLLDRRGPLKGWP